MMDVGETHHRGTYKFLCRMDNFSGIYFNYIDLTFLYDTVKGVFLIGKKKLKRYYDQLHFFFTIDAILRTTMSRPLF